MYPESIFPLKQSKKLAFLINHIQKNPEKGKKKKSELTENIEGEAWLNGLNKLGNRTGKRSTRRPARAPPL